MSNDKHDSSRTSALQTLYPFLHNQSQDGSKNNPKDAVFEQRALIASVHEKATASVSVKQAFFQDCAEQIVATARTLAAVYARGGQLFSMGNGGSSCDAAHIAVEFLHPVTTGRPALSAVNLCADTAMLSAVGNDIGFEHIFVRPLIAQAHAGDGLIGLSTSGNSDNLLAAFAKAKQLDLSTIGLTGMDGGAMATSADLDHCLVVPTDSIHRIQECHLAIYHILWDLVHTLLSDQRGGLRSNL